MVHDRFRIGFLITRQSFVCFQTGSVYLFESAASTWMVAVFLALLVQPQAISVQRPNFGKLLLIEHRHVPATAPAVEPLHLKKLPFRIP
jgi:hypothetical protein